MGSAVDFGVGSSPSTSRSGREEREELLLDTFSREGGPDLAETAKSKGQGGSLGVNPMDPMDLLHWFVRQGSGPLCPGPQLGGQGRHLEGGGVLFWVISGLRVVYRVSPDSGGLMYCGGRGGVCPIQLPGPGDARPSPLHQLPHFLTYWDQAHLSRGSHISLVGVFRGMDSDDPGGQGRGVLLL